MVNKAKYDLGPEILAAATASLVVIEQEKYRKQPLEGLKNPWHVFT